MDMIGQLISGVIGGVGSGIGKALGGGIRGFVDSLKKKDEGECQDGCGQQDCNGMPNLNVALNGMM